MIELLIKIWMDLGDAIEAETKKLDPAEATAAIQRMQANVDARRARVERDEQGDLDAIPK